MFGIDMNVIAFAGLAMLAAGGIAYGFLFDRVSSEVKTEKRIKSMKGQRDVGRNNAAARLADAAKRKKSVQDSLKDLEEKQREKHKKSLTLRKQILQAGLKIDMRQFVLISIACGLFMAVVLFLVGAPAYVAAIGGIVGALGLPRWMIGRMRKRRFAKFLEEFPNAVDVIVRGVKAGLPINDCMAIIAKEAKEPVAGEFRRIIESQQMGLPLPEAVTKIYDSMPLSESNFFAIVLSIQSQAGGNLSEALGNLANVLRDRKKMKGKIQAMSAEAKASGMIIGALPLIVMLLVYLTTPDYIMILFNHPTGNLILLGSAIWMGIGIFVMKKMISFDF
jgi:tight adherence protein B